MEHTDYIIEEISSDAAEEIVPPAVKFSSDEPLGVLVDFTNKEIEEITYPPVMKLVQDGLCVAARSKHTGAIVGLLLGHIIRKNGDFLVWGALESENEKIKYFAKVNTILESSVDVLEKFNCPIALNFALICVDHTHRGKGLGLMMAKELEQIAKRKGIKAFTVIATNIATKKIFQKIGYDVVFEYDYNQLEMNGKKLFDISLTNGTTHATILTKRV